MKAMSKTIDPRNFFHDGNDEPPERPNKGELPQFLKDLISSPPRHGDGVHNWLFKVSRQLHAHRDSEEIFQLLAASVEGCGRRVPEHEIRAAIEASKSCAWQPNGTYAQGTTSNAPKWPATNEIQRAKIITQTAVGLADLWESSPTSCNDDAPDAEWFIDALFPGNPLLCVGTSSQSFETKPREDLRGALNDCSLIVPSPMSALTGKRKSDGKESAHTLDNTGPRKYLVTEFDKGSYDEQAAIIQHLSRLAPLSAVVSSGGKSLHAWWHCEGVPEATVRHFFTYGVTLGADPATWTPSQFVRLPGGWRADKQARQNVFFFNPEPDTPWFVPDVDPAKEPPPEAAPPEGFAFTHFNSLGGAVEAMDFVEGILTEGGASVVYGPSNCGKSFWIVDLCAAVASGKKFRDELEVDQGAVIYIALEGAVGARNRMEALKRAGKLKPTDPFYLVFDSVSLMEKGHGEKLSLTVAAVAAQASMPVKLVVIDTMARAMAGGDENSGEDMSFAVSTIDAVRATTKAHVNIVHHSGKDIAKGSRGHSSLRAAIDTEIEIFRPEGESISTARATKQRDLQAGEPMPFSLKVVELGINRRGRPITSCIVHHEDEIMATTQKKAGRPTTGSVDSMLSLLPQPSTSSWERDANAKFGITRAPFYRFLTEIKLARTAIQRKKEGWILNDNSLSV